MDWKLYYGTRSIFSSDDGDWLDAPFFDVAGLAIPEPSTKRQIITGDYYVLWNETPHSPEFAGLLDYLFQIEAISYGTLLSDISLDTLRSAGVKLGRMYDNAEWCDLWEWIVADSDETWW